LLTLTDETRTNSKSPKRSSAIDGEVTSIGGYSLLSGSLKSQKVAEQVKKLDVEIKKRLSNNFNSVRKAFLELDEQHNGYLTAEELAKFIGA
jgi:hypothetical protein